MDQYMETKFMSEMETDCNDQVVAVICTCEPNRTSG